MHAGTLALFVATAVCLLLVQGNKDNVRFHTLINAVPYYLMTM